jgi:hypothetical protein
MQILFQEQLMQLTLQSVLIVVLPLLGLVLPGVLKQDRYSPQANSLIAGIVVILASVGTAYSKDQFGPNFFLDTAVVIAGISALLAKPLSGLDAYLQGNVFALIQKQLPAQTPSNLAVATSTLPSNALIHITANTVHIPTAQPVVASPQQVATPVVESMPEVTTVQEHIDASFPVNVPGAIVEDVTPVVTGVMTPDEAGQKTQKIAVVKPLVTTPLEK